MTNLPLVAPPPIKVSGSPISVKIELLGAENKSCKQAAKL